MLGGSVIPLSTARLWSGLFSLLILLAACSSEESKVIEKVRADIAANARDPSSVQFRDLRLVGEDVGDGVRGGYVCGEVNLPNGYGGYNGFRKFNATVVWGSSNDPLIGPLAFKGDDANGTEWLDRCSAANPRKT